MEVPPAAPLARLSVHGSPNPARSALSLRIQTLGLGFTNVRVYDMAGRRVRTLLDRPLAAGTHVIDWDLRDAGARRLLTADQFPPPFHDA